MSEGILSLHPNMEKRIKTETNIFFIILKHCLFAYSNFDRSL